MDITIKDIPVGITEKEVNEWVSILIERFHNKKLVVPQEDIDKAHVDIDTFRETNKLDPKFQTSIEVIEVVK